MATTVVETCNGRTMYITENTFLHFCAFFGFVTVLGFCMPFAELPFCLLVYGSSV
jgi:hypothetical protein